MTIPAARHIFPLCRKERPLLARFVVTSVGRAGASMAVILLISEFLSGALGERHGLAGMIAERFGAEAVLWVVAVLLIAAYVGGSLLNYDNQVTQQRLMKVVELGMMERLIRHLLTLSVPFFDRQSHGDIIQAVRQDVQNLRFVAIAIAGVFVEGILAAALAVSAVVLSPWLAFWGLLALPVASLPIYVIAKRTLAHSYKVRKTGYVLFDLILQILRGIRVIKAYRAEESEAAQSLAKGRRYFDEVIEMVRVRSLAQVALESLAGLGIVVAVVVGGFAVMHGTLTWPNFLAFILAARALHGPLHAITGNYVLIQTHGASIERIDELLATEPEVRDRPDAVPLSAAPRTIAFADVGFSYGDAVVLEGVSFEVRAGETLGIAGPSGAGKTTLLNLIARFYDPTSGRILVNGRDLRDFRVADVYDQVAIVTQEPFLFPTTVRDNIRCGRTDASDEDVEAAARAAYIHDEILALPEGYDTPIGVGGRGLSAGQAQRINVARALLKNPPMLLLDEATSSLDSVAEAEVQGAIDRLMVGRTTFIVAHRLSTLRNADRILVLDRGVAMGLGSHDALLRDCSLYRRLWETQQMGGAARVAAVTTTDSYGAEDVPLAADLAELLNAPGSRAAGT